MKQSSNETSDSSWKNIIIAGGVAAMIPVVIGVLDIVLTFLPVGAAPEPGKGSAQEWFTLLQNNWFMGLRGLGLWNIITLTLTIPLYLALYGVFRHTHRAYAVLALVVFCIGASIYIANNPALSMFGLSNQYAASTSEAQKSMLVATAQSLLAQAEDFTPGSFWGFLLPEVAGFIMTIIMLRSQLFSRLAAWAGILGFALLLTFTVWATFFLSYYDVALMLAAVGGLLCMVWYIMVARRLFQLAK